MNRVNEKVTAGDQKICDRLKGGRVTALLGNSAAGYGWRPVCKGLYLGNSCSTSEASAIKAGEKYLSELEGRVKALRPKVKKVINKSKGKGDGTTKTTA